MRARERKRESKRERDKCLEAEKMKENEMSKGFFFFFKCYGKGWVEFGYILFLVKWGSMGF